MLSNRCCGYWRWCWARRDLPISLRNTHTKADVAHQALSKTKNPRVFGRKLMAIWKRLRINLHNEIAANIPGYIFNFFDVIATRLIGFDQQAFDCRQAHARQPFFLHAEVANFKEVGLRIISSSQAITRKLDPNILSGLTAFLLTTMTFFNGTLIVNKEYSTLSGCESNLIEIIPASWNRQSHGRRAALITV